MTRFYNLNLRVKTKSLSWTCGYTEIFTCSKNLRGQCWEALL